MKSTFRSLEKNITHDRRGRSPLEVWYERVRDIPIDQLSEGDLARAVRQSIFPCEIAETVLTVLERNPLACDLYDGELLRAVCESAEETLRLVPDWKTRLVTVLRRALETLGEDYGERTYFEEKIQLFTKSGQ